MLGCLCMFGEEGELVVNVDEVLYQLAAGELELLEGVEGGVEVEKTVDKLGLIHPVIIISNIIKKKSVPQPSLQPHSPRSTALSQLTSTCTDLA